MGGRIDLELCEVTILLGTYGGTYFTVDTRIPNPSVESGDINAPLLIVSTRVGPRTI
jgi:hypothetical protein